MLAHARCSWELKPAKAVLGTLTTLLLLGQPAQAREVEGVVFDSEVRAGDSLLLLRGYGLLRHMVVIKAYDAAFYLPEGIRSEEALGDVPKQLEIEYFHPIVAQDFAKATRASIARNVSLTGFQRLQPKIDGFNRFYRDIAPGDRYALTYVPGSGTTLYWNGRPSGIMEGSEFAAELFGIWLGANPLDNGLKRLLLGGG
jgi:hypothetical protein